MGGVPVTVFVRLSGFAAILTACAPYHPPIVVVQPPAVRPPAGNGLRAGCSEVDVTPPPGLPIWGSSIVATSRALGYRGRLLARVVLLEDDLGERLALVQLDLGGPSGLLHRLVASRVADLGLGPDRLMVAATHTHGAPGGYFGNRYFDDRAASRSGFDPGVLELLAGRLERGLRLAASRLEPAALAYGEKRVDGLSRNRSREAWESNPDRGTEVDDMLRLVRIDAVEAIGAPSRPLAAIAVYAVHGTAAGSRQRVYHGDLMAFAADALRRREPDVVFALLNGAEGDVSPAYGVQSFAEAERLGGRLAEGVLSVFDRLTAPVRDVRLRHAYTEVEFPRRPTRGGVLCESGVVGVPVLGGAEDARSFLHGCLGIREGRPGKDRGCQGAKRTAFGCLQGLLLDPDHFPTTLPFQVFRLGDLVTLATVPGEPTTELGRRIRQAVAKASPRAPVAVVGLANEYVNYFTTESEYQLQHYEGGSTLYGPHQGEAAVEVLESVASSLAAQPRSSFDTTRTFRPGAMKSFLGDRKTCRVALWRILSVNASREGAAVRFQGLARGERCPGDGLPPVSVTCAAGGGGSGAVFGESDRGTAFDVRRSGAATWTARWDAAHAPRTAPLTCRFLVARDGAEPLSSTTFVLPALPPEVAR